MVSKPGAKKRRADTDRVIDVAKRFKEVEALRERLVAMQKDESELIHKLNRAEDELRQALGRLAHPP